MRETTWSGSTERRCRHQGKVTLLNLSAAIEARFNDLAVTPLRLAPFARFYLGRNQKVRKPIG
jgi:hypothetical protein